MNIRCRFEILAYQIRQPPHFGQRSVFVIGYDGQALPISDERGIVLQVDAGKITHRRIQCKWLDNAAIPHSVKLHIMQPEPIRPTRCQIYTRYE